MGTRGPTSYVLSALLSLTVVLSGCDDDEGNPPDTGADAGVDAGEDAGVDGGENELDAGTCVTTQRWLMPDPIPESDGGIAIIPPLSCQQLLDCRAACAPYGSGCRGRCEWAVTPKARSLRTELERCYYTACDGGTCPESCPEQVQACSDNSAFRTLADGGTEPDVPTISTGCIPEQVVGKWRYELSGTFIMSSTLTITAEGRFQQDDSSFSYRSSFGSHEEGWIEVQQGGDLRFLDTVYFDNSTVYSPPSPPREDQDTTVRTPRTTQWQRTENRLSIFGRTYYRQQ
jgi:hypothetical protein